MAEDIKAKSAGQDSMIRRYSVVADSAADQEPTCCWWDLFFRFPLKLVCLQSHSHPHASPKTVPTGSPILVFLRHRGHHISHTVFHRIEPALLHRTLSWDLKAPIVLDNPIYSRHRGSVPVVFHQPVFAGARQSLPLHYGSLRAAYDVTNRVRPHSMTAVIARKYS